MKSLVFTGCAAAIGFLAGFGFPGMSGHREASATPPIRLSARKSAEKTARPADASDALIAETTGLTPAKWPAYFRARMNHPNGTDLAERLWAEQDPAGFWNWLIQQRDGTMLKNYGKILLHQWALADPDAAMRAANAVTDKSSSDLLRTEVIESVLNKDLAKGLSFAAQASDFNSFSWGERDWISRDPGAAVQGLATLPTQSEYRDFLNYAVEDWAKKDTPGLLAWLKDQPEPLQGEWYEAAFKFAAVTDSHTALEAARHLPDPAARDAAVTGVLSSGKIPMTDIIASLPDLTLPQRSRAAISALQNTPIQTPVQIAQATQLLVAAPANRNTLETVSTIADKLKTTDERIDWACLLPDSALRRRALESAANRAQSADELTAAASTLPLLDLSNRFFTNALSSIPDERKEEWIAKLPPDRAAWARAAIGKTR